MASAASTAASIDESADQADLANSAIYYNFVSKGELVVALLS